VFLLYHILFCAALCVSNNNNNNIEPVAVETLGVFNASARQLLNDLGRRISLNSGEARETSFLYQRISILVQRFNAVHDSLPAVDSTDWRSYLLFIYFSFNFWTPSGLCV